jgi:hypothetical protein
MNAAVESLEKVAVQQQCRALRLPAVAEQCAPNELVEAKQQLQLRRVLARWERYDLIAIDEVGYVRTGVWRDRQLVRWTNGTETRIRGC